MKKKKIKYSSVDRLPLKKNNLLTSLRTSSNKIEMNALSKTKDTIKW